MKSIYTHSGLSTGLYSKKVTIEGVRRSSEKNECSFLGLCESGIKESQKRIRSAFESSGLNFPKGEILINIFPADFKKKGAHLDLPIAITLYQMQDNRLNVDTNAYFIGELGMDGSVRPVPKFLTHLLGAVKAGFNKIYCPEENLSEIPSPVKNIKIYPIQHLSQLSNYEFRDFRFKGSNIKAQLTDTSHLWNQFKDSNGIKRLMLTALLGKLNVLLIGTPGSGKSMISNSLISFMEIAAGEYPLEMAAIYHMAGLKPPSRLPFRSPHHSISEIGLSGGGNPIRPGELSLASGGILFLDELPEFKKSTLECLRQPLEAKSINIIRANEAHQLPADFSLIATANPCPCGWSGDPAGRCVCNPGQIFRYQSKISGPILERFDMVIQMNSSSASLNESVNSKYDFSNAYEILIKAKKRLKELSKNPSLEDLLKIIKWNDDALELFWKEAPTQSHRSKFRTFRLASLLAIIDQSETVTKRHIKESIRYRITDSNELYEKTVA